MKKGVLLVISLLLSNGFSFAQHSVARLWNEVLLEAIRNDFARPTVHARNLFHTSAAMYDAWAAYDPSVDTYFLRKQRGAYVFPFAGTATPDDVLAARQEAISYASYRLIRFRFRNSPGWQETQALCENLMDSLGYDPGYASEEYRTGSPAALGNYIAARVIEFGLQDGANEGSDYQNVDYQPVNPPLVLAQPGNPDIVDPNRWQPLRFASFIDQAGHELPGGMPSFIGAEWGKVTPFALKKKDLTIRSRDGVDYWVYHDPNDPCYISADGSGTTDDYQWNFSLTAHWSSHLDPSDGVVWDISPASIGNLDINEFPETIDGLTSFYNQLEGGDPSPGYTVNPTTNQPYEPQRVPRGDYTRVLAEFWADGPASETPPGHWFTILNYVNDHPLLQKQFQGEGEVLDPLEWDVKSYFILGGAMHDAAVAVWGIKGYYDFIRPISAIRYMADQGQSTDESLPNYHLNGIPLSEGYVEVVEATDPLAGANQENVGKIKLWAWRGPYEIQPTSGRAGVGWILAENWWPYQRATFVTPAFAGYVSGHSTFSRAAATVLTRLTGDPYFPGGMGEFMAERYEFLEFEVGPSTDVVLQWAKYTDASDQCSLSRIWGGIHPPIDDIRGRLIGEEIGKEAFNYAKIYFENSVLSTDNAVAASETSVFPNPVKPGTLLHIKLPAQPQHLTIRIRAITGTLVVEQEKQLTKRELTLDTSTLRSGMYVVSLESSSFSVSKALLVE